MNNIEVDDTIFVKDIEEFLLLFKTQKGCLIRYLNKYFKENVHFIKKKDYPLKRKRGGSNKEIYLLTNQCFDLFKDTYNLKHRYLTKIVGNFQIFNPIMTIENQTIGWIENSYKDIEITKRQHTIGIYKVDLYFQHYNLVLECDENDHRDRNKVYESERQDYIISEGKSIIRFDPNNKDFDLSFVLREVHRFIRNYTLEKHEPKIITVSYD